MDVEIRRGRIDAFEDLADRLETDDAFVAACIPEPEIARAIEYNLEFTAVRT